MEPPPSSLVTVTWAAATAAAVALLLGVVTTGAGPHAGDAATPRNGLDLEWLQHLHSYSAYAMLGLTLALAMAVARPGALERFRSLVLGLLAVELAQIVIGVAQARLGVPALLVGIHMLLACVIVSVLTALVVLSRAPGRLAHARQTRHGRHHGLHATAARH
jgi:cytochrome c oxidase assembly protein subunit 15